MFSFSNKNNDIFPEESKIAKYRKEYFFIIEEAHQKSGYSKNEYHSIIKEEVLSKLNFKLVTTTKDLNEEEWPIFINAVKRHVYETLDLIF